MKRHLGGDFTQFRQLQRQTKIVEWVQNSPKVKHTQKAMMMTTMVHGEQKKKMEKPKKASVAKCLIVQFFFLFHSTVLCYNKARDISLFCTRRTPKIYEHNVSPHSRCMNTYTRTYTETPTNISLWYSASAPSLSFWLHCTKIEYSRSANRSNFSTIRWWIHFLWKI